MLRLGLFPTRRPTVFSYSLKHLAENWGQRVGMRSYVSNGALILAAFELGLTIKPYDDAPGCPNAQVGAGKWSCGKKLKAAVGTWLASQADIQQICGKKATKKFRA